MAVTALTRIDGVEGYTHLIHQLGNGLSIVSGLTVTVPHLRVIVGIVIKLSISGLLVAIQDVVVAELTITA